MKPTARQQRTWDGFKREANAVDLYNRALGNLSANAIVMDNFAKDQKLASPGFGELYKRTEKISAVNARLSLVVQAVETEKLGLRFGKNGDFDILAPAGTTSDEIAHYQLSGFGWILIAVGVVVCAAAVGWIAWLRKENQDLVEDYNDLLDETDNEWCVHKDSPLCQAWLQRRANAGYEQKKTASDKLIAKAKAIGKTVLGGVSGGLLIAIPLLAWALFGRRRNG